MKTIYTFDRFSNIGVHILMLLFIALLLTGLIRIYPFLYDGIRVVKAFFSGSIQHNFGDWCVSDFVITLSFAFVVPIVLIGLIAGCIHMMCLNERDRVDTTISNCETVVGTLESFVYVEERYNHGDTLMYNSSFSIDNIHFTEVRIRSDSDKAILNDLMSGAYFTVYYQTKCDNNLILQMDMHLAESCP